MHFADSAKIKTTGKRGKTTGRESTHTVRGPEGQWIADVKEELAARPKKQQWIIKIVNKDKVLTSAYESEEQARAGAERIKRQRLVSAPESEAVDPTECIVELAS